MTIFAKNCLGLKVLSMSEHIPFKKQSGLFMKKTLLLCCLMYTPGLISQLTFNPLTPPQTAYSETNADLGGNIELISFQTGYPYDKICGVQWTSPGVNVLNSSADSIHSIQLELYKNGVLQQSMNYTEPIGPFLPRFITFGSISLSGAIELKVVVKGVNGMLLPAPLIKVKNYALSGVSVSQYLTLRIRTDNFAAENYWEITDYQGTVHAFGGNTAVGSQGGNTGAATAGPGTYANNTTLLIPIILPLNGCYQLHFVDAFGDGLCNDNGSYKLYDTNDPTNILAYGTCAFADKYDVFGTGAVNTAAEQALERGVKVFPNPAREEVTIAVDLLQPERITAVLVTTLGQEVARTEADLVPESAEQIRMSVSGLPAGIYLLQVMSGTKRTTMVLVKSPE